MTATAYAPARAATRSVRRRPSLARLTLVELRKMTDTRAGFWLLLVIAVVAVGMVVIQLVTGDPAGRSLAAIFGGTLVPAGVLLPVLGILSATGEFSQRTALTTFTLVPVRARTVAAKLAASVLLALALTVVCLAASAVGNLLVGTAVEGNGSWSIGAAALGTGALYEVIVVVTGVGFGMLLMNTPLAIVASFVLPTIWGVLTAFVSAIRPVASWLDSSGTLGPLTSGHLTGEGWAKIAATVAVWAALPLAAGCVRLARREIS
ncbi:MAG TPA: ABC transporter permease [Streptosporangiaceae bacterium]|jgi:hypothetical protein